MTGARRNKICRFVCFLILTFFLTLSVSGAAQAARFSGKYLLDLCELGADGKESVAGGHAACQAYIAGVLDYHAFLQGVKIAPRTDICVPPATSMNEIHATVLKYLKDNTQHDGFIAAPAVTMALYQRWPCKRRK